VPKLILLAIPTEKYPRNPFLDVAIFFEIVLSPKIKMAASGHLENRACFTFEPGKLEAHVIAQF
jgi:hypothetical protein